MTVSITIDSTQEAFVQETIRSGRFNNADEVVRTALQLLEEHEREQQARLQLEYLQQAIQSGIASGVPIPLDLDSIKLTGRMRIDSSRLSPE